MTSIWTATIGRRQNVIAMPEMQHSAVLGAFSHRSGRGVPLIDMPTIRATASSLMKTQSTEFNTVCTALLVSRVNRIYRLSWTDVEAHGNFCRTSARIP
ncbi:hypothetical protein [Candidatus Desulfovibrio trichonymphae]|uniref:hypothetical protein n=1 Tax=Candidatus Desulfovibrio trichonymphae TaxID=1725232 RepID=UPI0011AB80DB|nr:hypothetical protein [Candidatus Desulfovibrio trichonymphae]